MVSEVVNFSPREVYEVRTAVGRFLAVVVSCVRTRVQCRV